MKTRIAIVLGLVLAATPASVAAQADASPSSQGVDLGLIEQLCAATAADEAELAACVGAVGEAVTDMLEEAPDEEPSLLDRAQSILDETQELIDATIAEVREVDLQAALDDVVQNAQDFEFDVDIDVQGALDDAVAAFEEFELDVDIDVQQAIDDAVREALAATEDIDLETAIDEALAGAQGAIEDAELQAVVDDTVAALEQSVEEARAVVTSAQEWAQQNTDAVCRGGSVSFGTTVGVAVFVLTGVEWLGLQAFWATERFTNGFCGDFVR
jgi:hypothetical protein